MLVVFEGIDGSGKNTQIELLKKNFGAVVFKYPTRKFQLLNEYLERKLELDRKALFLLFLADIAEEQNSIKKALIQHKYVFVDRYVFSTIAYEINSFSYNQARDIVGMIDFIKPDKAILLDIDARTAQKRKIEQKKLDRYEEDVGYLEKVRKNFLNLYGDGFLAKQWHLIDATKPVLEITKLIGQII